ncbi:MAG: hypothetical protein ACLURV_08465 [Gallintestinimicrobium sp.]
MCSQIASLINRKLIHNELRWDGNLAPDLWQRFYYGVPNGNGVVCFSVCADMDAASI